MFQRTPGKIRPIAAPRFVKHLMLETLFEENRRHLFGVAFRMLGSLSEAEDAVQESWFRLSRSDAAAIENMRSWLTTVVARVCLDMLRSRKSRREDPLGIEALEKVDDNVNPEHEAVLADSVGLALLVVLETLSPAERVAFVLHDMFDVPFDDIALIVGRSPQAARQLASRGRRRVRGVSEVRDSDLQRRREVVSAFLEASRQGNFEALLALLDPNAAVRADAAAVLSGAVSVTGAKAVAETFAGRARAAQTALIDGTPGLVWRAGGETRVVFHFTIVGDRITSIDLIADRARISSMDIS
jgi:RNA polymerase sigma-70 factor (ECF subfamily)